MTKDTVIGVGVGLLVGWLLWRRRGLAAALEALGAGSGSGACCGGCAGSGAGSGGCGQALSAGVGSFKQGAGPAAPVY